VSSQHDEAPARPDESAPPAGPKPSDDSVPAGSAAPGPLSFSAAGAGPAAVAPAAVGPAAVGPEGASAAGYGQPPPLGTGVAHRPPWKAGADGRTVFRRGTPFVVWWAWVAFAIFNLAEIAIPDHDYFSLEFTAALLAVTSVMYACTLRPRVLSDDDGVVVRNPYRSHRIRWGALTGVYLGDSVELCCARSTPGKEKTIYCWALYSGRRSRLRGQMRTQRNRGRGGAAGAAERAHAEAQELARQDIVQLMAAEIGRRSTVAKERGVPDAVLESGWAWLPLVYALLAIALLVGLVLGR
jgi:hypothetical protein